MAFVIEPIALSRVIIGLDYVGLRLALKFGKIRLSSLGLTLSEASLLNLSPAAAATANSLAQLVNFASPRTPQISKLIAGKRESSKPIQATIG